MFEGIATGHSLPDAYHLALWWLKVHGKKADCPDYYTTQKEMSMTMVVEEPFAEPMVSKLFIGGPRELEQYRQEILDGILDFEVEKGNWAYTYHQRIVDQMPFIIKELRRNPHSRRAVIDVRDKAFDMNSDDPACLQHIQYFVRDGKLHCKVLFRSNDACKATFMNAFALIMLQKRVADLLGIPVGTYAHRANSFHCYERDFPMLDGYVKRIEHDPFEDITYNYCGDWDEMMEEAKPEIAEMVKKLKRE